MTVTCLFYKMIHCWSSWLPVRMQDIWDSDTISGLIMMNWYFPQFCRSMFIQLDLQLTVCWSVFLLNEKELTPITIISADISLHYICAILLISDRPSQSARVQEIWHLSKMSGQPDQFYLHGTWESDNNFSPWKCTFHRRKKT